MGKNKKAKNYDLYIAPGKQHLYQTRRLLFLLSASIFVLDLSVIAILDPVMRKNALISMGLSAVFAVLQLVDNRKANWNWPYIIVLSGFFLLFAAFAAFATEWMFMRYVWAGETVFFLGLVVLLLRRKNVQSH